MYGYSDDGSIKEASLDDKQIRDWIIDHIMENNEQVRPTLQNLKEIKLSCIEPCQTNDSGKKESTTLISSCDGQNRFFSNDPMASSSSSMTTDHSRLNLDS